MPGDGGDLGEGDHLRPDVDAVAGRILRAGEWDVAEPPRVGSHVQEERHIEENDADEVRPIAERVQTRERDVARADHERHEVQPHCVHHGHGEEEHHRRAVHGEDLIVFIRPDERVLGPSELHAHRGCLEPAGDEHEKGRNDVPFGDRLVARRGEPTPESGRVLPQPLEHLVLARHDVLGQCCPGRKIRVILDRRGRRWAARALAHLSVSR
jgi:hypothetical protein